MESRKNAGCKGPASHLSHIDASGNARMVDVSGKSPSVRRALAEGELQVSQAALALLAPLMNPKGDAFTTAKLAGTMAAKQTSTLIPLCHNIGLSKVDVQLQLDEDRIVVRGEVVAFASTGVEMEALTAVSVALLTLYDMLKSADKRMIISGVRLLRKEGGASGTYEARPLAEG